MRLLAPLLLALLAASGCIRAPEPPPSDAPPAFERAEAPLLVLHAQNRCGLCSGAARFEYPEWSLFAVFEDGRALRAHYNPGEGSEGVRLAPGVRYDRAELDALFRAAIWPSYGESPPWASFWVAEVETGEVQPGALARLRDALDGSWRWPAPSLATQGCLDCAGHGRYARPGLNTSFDIIHPDLPPPNGTPPQQDFRTVMDAFADAEKTFRATSPPAGAAPARVVRVMESFAVMAPEGDRLRGPGRCVDAQHGEPIVVPQGPRSPPPSLVVLRAIERRSMGEAIDPQTVDPLAHFTAVENGTPVRLPSALDPGRALLTLQVRQDGALLVDGEPLRGERTFRVEHVVEQGRPDGPGGVSRGVARFEVVETLVVTDAGTLPVQVREEGALCSG